MTKREIVLYEETGGVLKEMLPAIKDNFDKGNYGIAGLETVGTVAFAGVLGVIETGFLVFQLPTIAVLAIDEWGQKRVAKKSSEKNQ